VRTSQAAAAVTTGGFGRAATSPSAILRARFDRKNRELGIQSARAMEVFRVTAWGVPPDLKQLLTDFPPLHATASNLESLEARLKLWNHD
jgi:hypothetical protein